MTQTQARSASDVGAGIRVAVSTVIFALRELESAGAAAAGNPAWRWQLVLPLVRRIREPFRDRWALPGGWLREDEDLAQAAARTLHETTGLEPSYLEQLYAFGALDRSPSRVVSIVYWALVRADDAAVAVPEQNVAWYPVAQLPGLAFDHAQIIDYALWRLRNKVGYSRIAQGFLPETFTLAELREVYESVLERSLDPANFRRQVEGSGAILATEHRRTGSHRPARLYRSNHELELADRGPLPHP